MFTKKKKKCFNPLWKKHERNNEQCKHNMPLQILWSGGVGGGHKLSEPANLLWKERVPHPLPTWRLFDKNDTQLLQSLIIITQPGRDNAVASASDCRYRGHEFETTPCHITDVKANHMINLPSTDSRRAIVSYWRMYRYACARGIHMLLVLGGLRLRTVLKAHWPARYDL